ncbi:MAG TPA: J domain-containing protein [Polyangiaceae bacterium]
MSHSPDAEKPKPISGIDVRKLPIGPEEAFVLSRVDGFSTAREIGYATSLPEPQVERTLRRLSELGAIAYAPASDVACAPQAPLSQPAATSVLKDTLGPDLAQTRQEEILELYEHLDQFDHYQLLGLARDADRRAVKAAYYEKVRIFHPDRYFGKDLGPFRTKLEQCFARLTAAHDTLSVSSRRDEYDEYLGERQRAAELERALSQSVTMNDLDELEEQLGAQLNVQGSAGQLTSTTARSSIAQAKLVESTPPASQDVQQLLDLGVSAADTTPRMTDEDRKRFLARKLRVSSVSLRAPPRFSTPSPSDPMSLHDQSS